MWGLRSISPAMVLMMIKLCGILNRTWTRYNFISPTLSISYDVSSVANLDGDLFHIIDRENVSLLLSPDLTVCRNKHIFVITSAIDNRHLRNNVRNYLKSRAGWIFLHGTREKNQESLREENAAFGDILQGDFPDTYPFLSYKVIMSFIWINKFCRKQKPVFLIKMDDDTIMDYDQVAASLELQDSQYPGEESVHCPSVLRNQKLWTHQGAPIMGKWAYLDENEYTGNRSHLPDYCNGNLYALPPKVGLGLAEGARSTYHYFLAEDCYITGLVQEAIPEINLRSLSPVGGSAVWDGVLSHCPLLAFLRYAFNPLVVSTGAVGDNIQYVNSPKFVACVALEVFNYEYLLPAGLFMEPLNHICSRN